MRPEVAWLLKPITGEDPQSCIISSEDEARYRQAETRQRLELVAGRAAVRDLLAMTQWARWQGLTTNKSGRPRLVNSRSIDVSLSHSHGWILAGACRGARIGVDVEKVTSVFAEASLRRMSCTRREWVELESLPALRAKALMADIWTRKESFLKALGTGLRLSPRDVRASDERITQLHSGTTGLSAALTLLPLDSI